MSRCLVISVKQNQRILNWFQPCKRFQAQKGRGIVWLQVMFCHLVALTSPGLVYCEKYLLSSWNSFPSWQTPCGFVQGALTILGASLWWEEVAWEGSWGTAVFGESLRERQTSWGRAQQGQPQGWHSRSLLGQAAQLAPEQLSCRLCDSPHEKQLRHLGFSFICAIWGTKQPRQAQVMISAHRCRNSKVLTAVTFPHWPNYSEGIWWPSPAANTHLWIPVVNFWSMRDEVISVPGWEPPCCLQVPWSGVTGEDGGSTPALLLGCLAEETERKFRAWILLTISFIVKLLA